MPKHDEPMLATLWPGGLITGTLTHPWSSHVHLFIYPSFFCSIPLLSCNALMFKCTVSTSDLRPPGLQYRLETLCTLNFVTIELALGLYLESTSLPACALMRVLCMQCSEFFEPYKCTRLENQPKLPQKWINTTKKYKTMPGQIGSGTQHCSVWIIFLPVRAHYSKWDFLFCCGFGIYRNCPLGNNTSTQKFQTNIYAVILTFKMTNK